MRRSAAADEGEGADLDVAGEHDVVGQHDIVGHHAVVADMGVGHEETARADDGRLVGMDGAVDGHVLAHHRAVADAHADGFAVVLQELAAQRNLHLPQRDLQHNRLSNPGCVCAVHPASRLGQNRSRKGRRKWYTQDK